MLTKKTETPYFSDLRSPEIKAQARCREGIERAGMLLYSLYDDFSEYFSGFSVWVSTYENGYIVESQARIYGDKLLNLSSRQAQIIRRMTYYRFIFKPDEFFNYNIREGSSHIEYDILDEEYNIQRRTVILNRLPNSTDVDDYMDKFIQQIGKLYMEFNHKTAEK